MDIAGKVAIVTGGAGGLGEATVRLYVEKGARVAIFDMNEEHGQELVKELGDAVVYHNVDVSSEEGVQSALDQVIKAFGELHICNNYAGIGSAHKTVSKGEAFPLDAFKKVLDVNLVGTFNVLRLAAVQMSKQDPIDEDGQRGVIINTASIAAYEGQIGQAAYSASKGGVVSMTLVAARDLASLGIRVNTIVPGLIHTPLLASLPEKAYNSLAASPLYPQRLGKAEEIARLSQYLVESDYTNGECVRLDAGLRMQPR